MNLAFQTQIVSDLHVVELCFTTSQACGALIDLHLGILLGRDVVFFQVVILWLLFHTNCRQYVVLLCTFF